MNNNRDNEKTHFLEGEGSSLATSDFPNSHALAVYTLDSDGYEVAERVRTQHQCIVQPDHTFQSGA